MPYTWLKFEIKQVLDLIKPIAWYKITDYMNYLLREYRYFYIFIQLFNCSVNNESYT